MYPYQPSVFCVRARISVALRVRGEHATVDGVDDEAVDDVVGALVAGTACLKVPAKARRDEDVAHSGEAIGKAGEDADVV